MASLNLLHDLHHGLLLSDDESLLEMEKIFQWISVESYWANGRERHVLEKAFTHSYPMGVYDGVAQVAVARIVSDSATFAWLCDVFVDSNYRGRGIGTWLAKAAVEWTEQNGIKRIVLATRDAHDVYSKAGFELLKGPNRWMEIDQRPQAKGN